jgi:hypothetical protein
MAVEQEYQGFRIRGLDTYSLQVIMPKGSGSVPNVLTGYWTNVQKAKDAIDNYLSTLVTTSQNKRQKRKQNDSEESTSSD